MKAVKILELSGDAWMGGISLQPTTNVGGLFREATNFDPFEKIGIYKTSRAGTQRGSATVTVVGVFNVGTEESGTAYFYSFADNKKVFKVAAGTGVVSDVSAQINHLSKIKGATIFKGKIIYAGVTRVAAGAIPLVLGSETYSLFSTQLVNSGGTASANHIMKIGPDRNLYITNEQYVGRITSVTGTAGNASQYLTFEDDVITRDLENDGQHLVIAGDNNLREPTGIVKNSRCFIAFWNMKSIDITRIWEFEDVQIYAIKKIENDIIVFCKNNIYICNVDTPPQILFPLRGETNLSAASIGYGNPGNVIKVNEGTILWGGTSGKIYGYGRPHPSFKRTFFKPYSITTGNFYSLFFDGSVVWGMEDTNKLWDFGLGTTRQSSTLTLSDIDFKIKYKFAFAKLELAAPLASGQNVDLEIKTQSDNKTVMSPPSGTRQFSFANFGAVSSHVFPPSVTETTGDAPIFEDLTNIEITNNKTEIRRLEIWGYPVSPKQNSGY